jgi:hypothetical protein
VHIVRFTTQIYLDARSHECQKQFMSLKSYIKQWVHSKIQSVYVCLLVIQFTHRDRDVTYWMTLKRKSLSEKLTYFSWNIFQRP